MPFGSRNLLVVFGLERTNNVSLVRILRNVRLFRTVLLVVESSHCLDLLINHIVSFGSFFNPERLFLFGMEVIM